ncbi:MAG: DNA polymerase III subunit delta [Armatimonadota bacterium]
MCNNVTGMAAETHKPLARAYLLRGDDEYQKSQALEELLARLVDDDFADFDLEQLEGDTATCEHIMTGLAIAPLGSRRRVMVIKFANKMSQEEQQKLARRLDAIPPSGCLILMNPASEKVDGRPKRGSEVSGELARAVRRVGEVREFGSGSSREKTNQAREFALSRIREAGKEILPEALALLIQRVGTDFSILASEIQKLVNWSGEQKKITPKDVETVTSETPEEKIFRFLDALAACNTGSALQLLDAMLESSDDPRADASRTLAMIARQFRLIWQARMLIDAGIKSFDKSSVPESVRAVLLSEPNLLDATSRQPWQSGKLAAQAREFPRDRLVKCFEAIARADTALKGIEGSIGDPRTIIEMLVIELAGGAGATARKENAW